MPFTEQTEYPSGTFTTQALTTTPQTVFSGKAKVSHMVLQGGAAAEIVIFRAVDNSPELFRIKLAIGETVVIPRGFKVDSEGLEILTASAAGDVAVTIWYFEA